MSSRIKGTDDCLVMLTSIIGISTLVVLTVKGLALFLLGFPGGSAGKETACDARDLGSIPELGRSPGEGNGYPLQYSGLENSMDYSMGSKRVAHD